MNYTISQKQRTITFNKSILLKAKMEKNFIVILNKLLKALILKYLALKIRLFIIHKVLMDLISKLIKW